MAILTEQALQDKDVPDVLLLKSTDLKRTLGCFPA